MLKFRAGEIDILVSTVVIEVGVDVPNASVMVVEDANRFGLSQLHQLRGRVGRGAEQSYCILIADVRSEEARRRLDIMCATTDGFKIAEEDLNIRGPGDILGTKQSGELDFKLADLRHDGPMLEEARQLAMKLLDYDPELMHPLHSGILERVKRHSTEQGLIAIS
jgi:ATP-dependent DNA helicase RecG